MKNNIFLIYSFLILFCFNFASCNWEDPRLNELDRELEKREYYHELKRERIAELMENMRNEGDNKDTLKIYKAYDKLYSEYVAFQFDSAYKYTTEMCNLGRKMDAAYWVDSQTKNSFVLGSGGFFKEAIDSLSAIDVSLYELPDSIVAEYHIALGRIYHNLADYCSDMTLTPNYNSVGNEELQKAINLVDDSIRIYWLKGKIELENNNIEAAKRYYERANELTPDTHFRKRPIHSTLPHIYYRLGDYDKALENYIACCINNVREARTESVSLRGLAMLLFYEKKEIKRAAYYINCALDDATMYSARHRKITIGDLLPLIVGEELELAETRNQLLFRYFTLIIILAVGLTILSFIILGQLNRLRQQKRLLTETNQNLSEANLIKEEYIGHYFHINSTVINNVEKFTQVAINKLKLKQYDELRKLIDNLAKDHNKKAFYKEFDRSFLKIFPTFVEDYNRLMPETERITTPEAELNTTLRIFALIRLGINDTEEISRIIDYSSNTVYNYRIRARKKSVVGTEKFEKLIRTTGI